MNLYSRRLLINRIGIALSMIAMAFGLLALLGNAFYAVLVHRLAVYAPRFLPTLGRPHAVALHFARCDQLTAGLAPAGVRPCWAHKKKRAASCDATRFQ